MIAERLPGEPVELDEDPAVTIRKLRGPLP